MWPISSFGGARASNRTASSVCTTRYTSAVAVTNVFALYVALLARRWRNISTMIEAKPCVLAGGALAIADAPG